MGQINLKETKTLDYEKPAISKGYTDQMLRIDLDSPDIIISPIEEKIKNKVVYFMSIDNAKFRSPVTPGDKLEYKVSVIKNRGKIWVLHGEAFVENKLVAEADLKAMIVDK